MAGMCGQPHGFKAACGSNAKRGFVMDIVIT
jgi:hypothetical protein